MVCLRGRAVALEAIDATGGAAMKIPPFVRRTSPLLAFAAIALLIGAALLLTGCAKRQNSAADPKAFGWPLQ
jgi:hypothetical protein